MSAVQQLQDLLAKTSEKEIAGDLDHWQWKALWANGLDDYARDLTIGPAQFSKLAFLLQLLAHLPRNRLDHDYISADWAAKAILNCQEHILQVSLHATRIYDIDLFMASRDAILAIYSALQSKCFGNELQAVLALASMVNLRETCKERLEADVKDRCPGKNDDCKRLATLSIREG